LLIEEIKGVELKLETSGDVFSPKNIDKGTLAMLSTAELKEDDKVLDLGCGYGVVGILAAKLIGQDKVTMVDIDERAVELSRENAKLNDVPDINIFQSDGFSNITDKEYTIILSNPPYHTDFSVPKAFIEKGFNRLSIGGRMYMVTKRKDWYFNKLKAIFGGVRLWEIDGYYVFMSIKKSGSYANAKKTK
jgi:16S rRNA (guanine1207-N2)-methyltransferase